MTAPSGSPDHNLIAHDQGKRILGVAVATGKVVEIRLQAGAGDEDQATLIRLENGHVVNGRLFSGPPATARAVLDAMRDTYWIDQAPTAPAPSAAPTAAPAAAPAPTDLPVALADRPRSSPLAVAIFALAGSVSIFGGYLVMRDAGRPAMPQMATATAPVQAPAPGPELVVHTSPTAQAGQAGRPTTPPPAVALPGRETAKEPSKEPAKQAEAPAVSAPVVVPAEVAPRPVAVPAAAPAESAPKTAAPKTAASVPPEPEAAAKGSEAPGPGGTFIDRSKAAAAQSEVTAADARKELETIGAEKAQANLEVMQQVYEALNRSDKISPEMALQLPHDLAQKLKEAGAILTQEEVALSAKIKGQPQYKIVRLSPEVYDKLRDADGIATVPASNSWAATGGNIQLPLPGGGDIKTPDDLKNDFGLQP